MKYLQILLCFLVHFSLCASNALSPSEASSERVRALYQNAYNLLSDHQIEAVIQLGTDALKEAESTCDLELLAGSHKVLTDAYTLKKEYKNAVEHSKAQLSIQDSIREISNQKYILGLELKEQMEKKEKEAALLENEKASLQAQTKRNRVSVFTVVCLLALSMFLAVHLNKNQENAQKIKTVLENEVTLRTADLVAINDRLKKQNKRLERFAYIASHDLKEPLKNINTFLSLIEKEMKEGIDENTVEYFGFIRRNTDQMKNLVDGILAYSRIGKIDIVKTSIDLNETTQNAMKSLQHLIDEREGQVSYDPLPMIECDAEGWNILLYHLIDNGLKYNESENPTVHISFHSYPDKNVVAVKDNGIGIDEAYHQQALTIFQRLHNRQAYDGAGIGLAICDKVVKNLDGYIQIDSVVGEGSTFNLVFPVD